MTDIKFNIIKTRVNAPVREIKATWTFEEIKPVRWEKIPQIKVDPNEWNVYSVYVGDITDWIHSQPLDKWNQDTTYSGVSKLRYRFSPEMESWFLLRWS
jgi:hypothetical protein